MTSGVKEYSREHMERDRIMVRTPTLNSKEKIVVFLSKDRTKKRKKNLTKIYKNFNKPEIESIKYMRLNIGWCLLSQCLANALQAFVSTFSLFSSKNSTKFIKN